MKVFLKIVNGFKQVTFYLLFAILSNCNRQSPDKSLGNYYFESISIPYIEETKLFPLHVRYQ